MAGQVVMLLMEVPAEHLYQIQLEIRAHHLVVVVVRRNLPQPAQAPVAGASPG